MTGAIGSHLSGRFYAGGADPVTMAPLTPKKRSNLASSSFAIPSERAYPINDISHARNALARSAGKPEEATVRRAVVKKYPSLKKQK